MEKIRKISAIGAKVVSIVRKIVFGGGCAVLVFTVLAAFVPLDKILDSANVSLSLGPVELGIAPDYLPETLHFYVVLMLLEALLRLVFAWLMLGVSLKILSAMEEGKPFDAEVSASQA